MTVLIGAAVATAGLIVIALVWGILHLRHSIRAAEAAIRGVTPGDIPVLREECVRVFREAFGDTLDLDDFEGCAQILSGRLDQAETLKRPFAREGLYWHFVLAVGAFMGELLRVHANGAWRPARAEVGGLELAIPLQGDFVQTFPFHKVIKHVTSGDPGDVYAYFMSSQQLDKIAEGAPA
jgi:hypothetical protein